VAEDAGRGESRLNLHARIRGPVNVSTSSDIRS
jgi:hypothetical protein